LDGFIKIKEKSKSINAPKVKIEGFSSKVIVQNDSKIDYG
jgi:hypothetical protein